MARTNKLHTRTSHNKFSKNSNQNNAKSAKDNKQYNSHSHKTNSTINQIYRNNNNDNNNNKKKQNRKISNTEIQVPSLDYYKPRIPHALRVALVSCFAKFNEFSLAKYNNESV